MAGGTPGGGPRPARPAVASGRALQALAMVALAICAAVLFKPSDKSGSIEGSVPGAGWPTGLAVQPDRTLVIYVYSATDPEYERNLRFFIDEAVKVSRTSILRIFSRPAVRSTLQFPARRRLTLACCLRSAQAGDGCDYIIVLQQGEGLADPDPLPQLPPNARYLRHANQCFDLGTVGWVLRTQVADTR